MADTRAALRRCMIARVRQGRIQGTDSRWRTGRVIHNAGGSEAQELAFCAGERRRPYLRAFEAGGIALDKAARMIAFKLAGATPTSFVRRQHASRSCANSGRGCGNEACRH